MHVTVLSHRAKRSRTTAATVTTSVGDERGHCDNRTSQIASTPRFMKKDATTFEPAQRRLAARRTGHVLVENLQHRWVGLLLFKGCTLAPRL
jgi:hypothetical protein